MAGKDAGDGAHYSGADGQERAKRHGARLHTISRKGDRDTRARVGDQRPKVSGQLRALPDCHRGNYLHGQTLAEIIVYFSHLVIFLYVRT